MISHKFISSRFVHPFTRCTFYIIRRGQVKPTVENGPSAGLSSENVLSVSSFPSFHSFVFHISKALHGHASHIISHFLARPVES